MKDKESKLKETEESHTLGGAYTLRDINLTEVALGLVSLCGPVHLCACFSEERGDREGAVSQVLSETLRYINLATSPPDGQTSTKDHGLQHKDTTTGRYP